MNKAITDGLVFMPPKFAAGLDVWSSEDGTPGSATYDGAANAALVSADQDFGGCLELAKTQATQKLRHMGQTPILPGCYLRVTARVKAISGNLPDLRIAAWAGDGSELHVAGLTETGPATTLTAYGQVETITAIIGSGTRTGVDMPWGTVPVYAHIGLDMSGPNGGVVRIDDIEIEDVTSAFIRDMMDWVDVRDYGAMGDGVTDDRAAFEAADTAANGRVVLVPGGSYYLGDHMTFENEVRFQGTLVMPADKRLSLTRNFDLPSYIDAFGDELEGFKRAIAALFNYSDHDSLDMKGRRVEIDAPIDVAAIAGKDSYSTRRVIRNGQISAVASANFDTDTVTSQATYSTTNKFTLTGVTNVANIAVGSLVTGLGVGREVYVRAKNVSAGTLTLSAPLFDAPGTQIYTFHRFKYMLDFSGFQSLGRFVISDVDLQCQGNASGVMLPTGGLIFHVRDCFFTAPKDRGLTSIGDGCQGLLVDRCQFLSNEQPMASQDRTTIAMNVNGNDTKIRDNRVVRFAHFGVWGGSGHMFLGNHFFQGDNEQSGLRQAGIVLTTTNVKTTFTGNYVDNCFIEWTNEHDEDPDHNAELSFGGLTVSDNIFTAIDVVPWFKFFVVKPVGVGHFIHGLNISGNTFKAVGGNIDRVDFVDTTYADLDMSRMRNVTVRANTFNGIGQIIANPVMLQFDEATPAATWVCSFAGFLPFGGRVRNMASVTVENGVQNVALQVVAAMPYAKVEQGGNKDEIHLVWPEPVSGRVQMTARVDNPV
ncbi:glycosyl hydrolase family 28-related protein [Actibacterium sp. XHP0104]|uniref:glycosyl hydrolase family 28-related protein n=1 Tax=Actibacterium sp. XHP0104 TaxID=2984335 RepID=UPI0021E71D4C|nr:glycosyl hydrolase family 28-related protein [Actibacterium sp. XHP0104]MCV2881762.1 right-handed parallel beta-helix repeat-containing protein [Actibacterium sp. XHP0104]